MMMMMKILKNNLENKHVSGETVDKTRCKHLTVEIIGNPSRSFLPGQVLIAEVAFDGDFARDNKTFGCELFITGQLIVKLDLNFFFFWDFFLKHYLIKFEIKTRIFSSKPE